MDRNELLASAYPHLRDNKEDTTVMIFNYLIPAGLVAVSLVLLAGLANMLRNGSPNTSQRLMRWRVGLQLFTIIIVMCGVYLSN